MAGRKAVPMSVRDAAGERIHRSNAEIDARREAEESLKVSDTRVEVPSYVTDKAKRKRFRKLAKLLQEVDEQLCTALDVDALAAYVDAQANYEFNQALVDEMHDPGFEIEGISFTYELERRERIRNASQQKADKLRSDLLLEPAARARAALVKATEDKQENRFERFA